MLLQLPPAVVGAPCVCDSGCGCLLGKRELKTSRSLICRKSDESKPVPIANICGSTRYKYNKCHSLQPFLGDVSDFDSQSVVNSGPQCPKASNHTRKGSLTTAEKQLNPARCQPDTPHASILHTAGPLCNPPDHYSASIVAIILPWPEREWCARVHCTRALSHCTAADAGTPG